MVIGTLNHGCMRWTCGYESAKIGRQQQQKTSKCAESICLAVHKPPEHNPHINRLCLCRLLRKLKNKTMICSTLHVVCRISVVNTHSQLGPICTLYSHHMVGNSCELIPILQASKHAVTSRRPQAESPRPSLQNTPRYCDGQPGLELWPFDLRLFLPSPCSSANRTARSLHRYGRDFDFCDARTLWRSWILFASRAECCWLQFMVACLRQEAQLHMWDLWRLRFRPINDEIKPHSQKQLPSNSAEHCCDMLDKRTTWWLLWELFSSQFRNSQMRLTSSCSEFETSTPSRFEHKTTLTNLCVCLKSRVRTEQEISAVHHHLQVIHSEHSFMIEASFCSPQPSCGWLWISCFPTLILWEHDQVAAETWFTSVRKSRSLCHGQLSKELVVSDQQLGLPSFCISCYRTAQGLHGWAIEFSAPEFTIECPRSIVHGERAQWC